MKSRVWSGLSAFGLNVVASRQNVEEVKRKREAGVGIRGECLCEDICGGEYRVLHEASQDFQLFLKRELTCTCLIMRNPLSGGRIQKMKTVTRYKCEYQL